jgi:hypothetical protein
LLTEERIVQMLLSLFLEWVLCKFQNKSLHQGHYWGCPKHPPFSLSTYIEALTATANVLLSLWCWPNTFSSFNICIYIPHWKPFCGCHSMMKLKTLSDSLLLKKHSQFYIWRR